MRALRFARAVAALSLTVAAASSCTGSKHSDPSPADPVIAAAGDIACAPSAAAFNGGVGNKNNCHEMATSDLLVAGRYAAVLPLGDDQYECGSLSDFKASYDPSWGRVRSVTHPVIGNHEYGHACHVDDPSGYFTDFGASTGSPKGYYSFDIGTWHIIILNSECSSGKGTYKVGGCQTGSAQERWLEADLAAHPARCTLAAWHEPRFSAGEHGDAQQMADIWNVLVKAHADVVLSGHNHDYERFEPIGVTPGVPTTPLSSTDKAAANFQQPVLDPDGIREFVVGTGGKNHYKLVSPPLTGETVTNTTTYGILTLTLHPSSYDWKFVPEPGATFTDAGSSPCH